MKNAFFINLLSVVAAAGLIVVLGGAAAAPHASAETLASGKDNNLEWSITTKGHLTVTGTGDWGDNHPERKVKKTEEDERWVDDEEDGYYEEYTREYYETEEAELYVSEPEWLEYKSYIKSATIKASGMSSLYRMFYGCDSLKKVDLKGFNTSKAQTMSSMFDDCGSLKSINLNGLNTLQVTDTSYAFAYCDKLEKADLARLELSKVDNMSSMFYGCDALTTIKWPSTMPKGANTSGLFGSCGSLE